MYLFSKKIIIKKASQNMIVKSTTVANFINILWAAFAPISFCQKVTKPITVNREKIHKALLYKKGTHIKCWSNRLLDAKFRQPIEAFLISKFKVFDEVTCDLSERLRYFFEWNSFSSSRSCSLVKAVLRRLAFDEAEFPCSQFHQHFKSSFCANILPTKNYKGKL